MWQLPPGDQFAQTRIFICRAGILHIRQVRQEDAGRILDRKPVKRACPYRRRDRNIRYGQRPGAETAVFGKAARRSWRRYPEGTRLRINPHASIASHRPHLRVRPEDVSPYILRLALKSFRATAGQRQPLRTSITDDTSDLAVPAGPAPLRVVSNRVSLRRTKVGWINPNAVCTLQFRQVAPQKMETATKNDRH